MGSFVSCGMQHFSPGSGKMHQTSFDASLPFPLGLLRTSLLRQCKDVIFCYQNSNAITNPLRCGAPNTPHIGKSIFSSNKEGFVKINVLCNSAHAGKEEGMERGELCCSSYTGLVEVAPFLCVDESLGNVQDLVWGTGL